MKKIFNSKTMWTGAAVTVLGALEQFDVTSIVQDNSGGASMLIGLAMIILRKVTKKQIH